MHDYVLKGSSSNNVTIEGFSRHSQEKLYQPLKIVIKKNLQPFSSFKFLELMYPSNQRMLYKNDRMDL